jgi:hypothetical protein
MGRRFITALPGLALTVSAANIPYAEAQQVDRQALEGQPTQQDEQGILPPGHPDGTVVGDGVQDLSVAGMAAEAQSLLIQPSQIPAEQAAVPQQPVQQQQQRGTQRSAEQPTNNQGQSQESGR